MLQGIDWRLVVVLICAIFALIVLFSWWFIFNRSVWRIVFLFFGFLFGRSSVDPDAPLPVKPKDETLSDVMLENVDKHSFDAALARRRGDTQTFTPLAANDTPPAQSAPPIDPAWQPRLDPDGTDNHPFRAWREQRDSSKKEE